MANFNRVILAGNLTRDPEMRYTPKGQAIAKITLAVNRSYTTETGEKREEVSFIDCDAFGKQAETLSTYMKKGRPLLVEGRLRQDTWEDKNTHQKQSKLKVVIDNFQFLGGRDQSQPGGPTPPDVSRAHVPANAPTPPGDSASHADSSPEEDDVPF
jgi:single-strand DNA-binding protein